MMRALTGLATRIKGHLRDSLFQNSYFLMGSTVGPSVVSILFWIFAARLYDAESVGYVTALFSSVNLLTVFASMGLGISLIRFLPQEGVHGTRMINTSLTLGGIASIIAALVFIAGLRAWSPVLEEVLWVPLVALAFISFTVVSTMRYLQSCVFLAKCKSRYTFVLNMITSLSKLGLLFLMVWISATMLSLFMAIGLSMVLGLGIGLYVMIPKVHRGYVPGPVVCADSIRQIGRYTTDNYISQTLLSMQPFILNIIAVNVLGAESSAYFYMAWSIGAMLIVFPGSIFNSLFAVASSHIDRAAMEIRRSVRLLVTMLLPGVVALVLLASYILSLFGTDYSGNGDVLLRLIAISVIPYSVNILNITMARVRMKSMNLLVSSVAMTALSLGLAFFFSTQMGIVGIGVGWLLGQTIVSVPSALKVLESLRAPHHTESLKITE